MFSSLWQILWLGATRQHPSPTIPSLSCLWLQPGGAVPAWHLVRGWVWCDLVSGCFGEGTRHFWSPGGKWISARKIPLLLHLPEGLGGCRALMHFPSVGIRIFFACLLHLAEGAQHLPCKCVPGILCIPMVSSGSVLLPVDVQVQPSPAQHCEPSTSTPALSPRLSQRAFPTPSPPLRCRGVGGRGPAAWRAVNPAIHREISGALG